MRGQWRWTAAVALAAVTAGCHSRSSSDHPAPDPNAPVPVEVESHYWGDVVIYLVTGSAKQRLGTVTAMSTATFTFRYGRLSPGGSTRLFAYPIAGARGLTSEPLNVQPGQSISWTLENDLDRSSLTVW
jgi:hypothetical protein